MTRSRKISVSLPEDIAAVLDGVDNASAYVAEAVRERAQRDSTREMMRRHGYEVTDAGVEKWRERLAALDRMRDDAA
jgi:hypothetical protein